MSDEYSEAWGLRTGMIVTTSYGSGPYLVESVTLHPEGTPRLQSSTWTEAPGPARVSLVMRGAPGSRYERMRGPFYINDIVEVVRRGELYRTMAGDEVRVEGTEPMAVQGSLF